MMRWRNLHPLSGAYAVDALTDPAEAERFERHLARCQACADEVRGMRAVATRLAFDAGDAEPPAAMRDNVLAAVARTRQLPPVVTAPGRRLRWLAGGFPVWTPRLVAVAAAVAAIVLGIQLSGTQSQLSRTQTQDRAIAAVLAAPDARVVTGQAAGGGTTTAVVSAASRSLVITSAGLPTLPGGKVYQLWLIGPSATRSAGLVPSGGGPVLAGGLSRGDRLAMTVEPPGGTSHPTTTPILFISVFS
jgi:anti-sigma-K factor RskA